MIRFTPANPSTSVHPVAADFSSGCSYSRNVDVGDGAWGIGERYRRWQPAPVRTYTFKSEDPAIETDTGWLAPSTVSQENRPGWTVQFSSLSNMIAADEQYASCIFQDEDDVTKRVRVSFAPTNIPANATISKVKARVLRKVSSTGGAYIRAVDDLVQGDADGTGAILSANVAELEIVPGELEWIEYELSGSLPSVANLNNGVFKLLLGWKGGSPKDSYEVGDVTATVSPAVLQEAMNTGNGASASVSTTYTVSVAHTGVLHPDAVLVNVQCDAQADTASGHGTPPHPPAQFGTATANNGLGASASHTAPDSNGAVAASATASSTLQVSVPLDNNGTGVYTFTATASATVQSGLVGQAYASTTASAAPLPPSTPPQSATLYVDAVRLKVEYTVPPQQQSQTLTLTGAQGIAYSDFGGHDQVAAVWGRGIFNVAGIHSVQTVGTSSQWSAERSGRLLSQGSWAVWVHDGKFFYAHPQGGVLYQTVGSSSVQELYLDAQSPGSTGEATYRIVAPPYEQQAQMDTVNDQVNGLHSSGSAGGTFNKGSFSSSASITTAEVNSGSKLATVALGTWDQRREGWVQIESVYGTARDFSGASVVAYTVEHRKTSSDDWGHLGKIFIAVPGWSRLELEDADGSVWRYTPKVSLVGNRYYAWADLSQGTQVAPGSTVGLDLKQIKKVRVRFGASMNSRGQFRVKDLVPGGTYYQNLTVAASDAKADNMADSSYAYRFYEVNKPNRAKKMVVADTLWLGNRHAQGLPYSFSIVQLQIPKADAPYTSAATIEVYRQVNNQWRLLAIGPNTDDLVFTDELADSVVNPDTVEYPTAIRNERYRLTSTHTGGTFTLTYNGQTTAAIANNATAAAVQSALTALSTVGAGNASVTGSPGNWLIEFTGTLAQTNLPDLTFDGSNLTGGTATFKKMYDGCGEQLDFSSIQPIDSGSVLGIVNGCSWKGSNVYLGNNGKIYFSRANKFDEVLWDEVVLTNDPGSSDLGPARTSVVPDNLTDPLVCAVPAENLYVATKNEIYVFVSGETAATASFPRKIDGARGAAGKRAGCVYGDSAVFGCKDGLWLVKKTSDYGEQPDVLRELTKDIRSDWDWLLEPGADKLVVRSWFGDLWAFCANRFVQLTRRGSVVVGNWADAEEIHDAAPTKHGLVFQTESGRMGIVGKYLTDGGTDLIGGGGVLCTWAYRGGRTVAYDTPLRAAVLLDGTGVSRTSLTVKARTASGEEEIKFNTAGAIFDKPFPRATGGLELGGGWCEIEMSALANFKALMLEVDMQERSNKRRPA